MKFTGRISAKADKCETVLIHNGAESGWIFSPQEARALAAELLAAADEAESEPRFSEEDLEAIKDIVWPGRAHLFAIEQGRLRSLRKKRGES